METPTLAAEQPVPPPSIAASYAAARTGAIVIDRTGWRRMSFRGAGAATVLNGLLSNEIASSGTSQVRYAAALTPKGKVLADVHVLVRPTDVLVVVAPAPWSAWAAMIRKYVNPRLARYEDVSEQTAHIGIYGPRATEIVAAVYPGSEEAVRAIGPRSLQVLPAAGGEVTIARLSPAAADGYDLIVPSDQRDLVLRTAVAAGGTPADEGVLDILRIEAGVPAYGADMDENTLPQEVHLDTLGAIAFDKGCYTGQETVARLHFRGHVNRSLRGLQADTPLTRGAELVDAGGNVVGDVRSVAVSPRLGPIALAMVRREVADGTQLTARGTANIAVRVLQLPWR